MIGIVRAIDAKQKLLYILTPLDEGNLCNVNVILKGSLELPLCALVEASLNLIFSSFTCMML